MLLESFDTGVQRSPLVSDELPAVIRAELNADKDQDLLARMRYLTRKKRMLRPDITDEEMADYLALAENFQNVEQWLSARRGTLETPVRASAAWIAATAVIIGLLSAMLIAAIAIAV
ncbi:MAG TPA: hypothetical protein VKB84_26155 [Candidatus Binataceae bacterium]|nr:hypothetical protein [Candidatus Binataceae bacterium]